MNYYCAKKHRNLKRREVEQKFHCLKQNYKQGCINLRVTGGFDELQNLERTGRKIWETAAQMR